MNIVFATAEMSPFAKTGGLADVCGSLPGALARCGHTVSVFLPKYKTVDLTRIPLRVVIDRVSIPVGTDVIDGRVYRYDYRENVSVFFVEQNEYFNRDHIYGGADGDYPDNDKRFIFFQKVVLVALKELGSKPAVIHCHDWQAGLIPAYIKTTHQDDTFFKQVKTFFTIHNLAYQGVFPAASFELTGLPASEFSMNRLEFYGQLNCMKSGIMYADVLTTVSERYAQEIQLKEYGCGLDGALRARRADVFGIVNGIDEADWNPETDRDITVNFSEQKIEKKYINKGVLQKENGLPVDRDIPLLGMITRLVDQKGLDILLPILPDIADMGVQVVILGTGEERYHRRLRELGESYAGKFCFHVLFDAKMAKRIYAGADMFLMPSRFEPCGLGQIVALRYGTVPVVRETGGLADTVSDFNPKTKQGNGVVFIEYTKDALMKAVRKALGYYKDKAVWRSLVANGFNTHFPWDASAAMYCRLYEREKRKEMGV
jgi:starch synthase